MPPLNYSLPILNSSAATEDPKVRTALSDIQAWANALQLPTFVTSLPSSPVDGQEIYFVADATFGIVWHFRYRSGSPNAQKWEFLGGPPLFARDNTQLLIGNDSFAATQAAPSVFVPLAGVYRVEVLCQRCWHSDSDSEENHFGVGTAGALLGVASTSRSPSADYITTLAAQEELTAVINQEIACWYGTSALQGRFEARRITVTPVRVG